MAHPPRHFAPRNRAGFAAARGLYDPSQEKDACGIGFLVRLDAVPQHELVENAVRILVNLEHRGAVGGDKSTGDGAGLLLQMPDAFFRREAPASGIELPPWGEYAVGSLFLPGDAELRARCERLFEETAEGDGLEVLGWRDVPTDATGLGVLATSTMPVFRQIFLAPGSVAADAFERKLYVVRRVVENAVVSWTDVDASQFYVCSLSSRTVNYKGLLTGTQLTTFYPDLFDEDFRSSFSLVHQRYSTNTLPTWSLAQPFRYIAHNGEINTLRGNINQMRAAQSRLASDLFGEDIERIQPVLVENGSDSAVFDNALELLVQAGRSIPHAMMMMIPEAWGSAFLMSDDKRAFYEYHAAMMEPWDGPASIAFTDGRRYVGGVLDRNGLRPSRYTVTRDGLLVLASETGVLELPGREILRRGRLQPGRMFLLDLEQHRIVPDAEIKGRTARRRPYRHWVLDNRIELRGLQTPSELPEPNPERLLRKQHLFGYTDEELRMILNPMASNGQEAVGSMGNDAALAVLSNRPQLLFGYFKQLFAQVTNPPIDPLREELVMSLMSFLGRQGNLLDETPAHFRRLKLNHPVLTPEDMERLLSSDHPDVVARTVEMLFNADGDPGEELERGLQRMFEEAERAVREGATILVLSDRHVHEKRAAIPSLLAVAGLHNHLIRQGLGTQADIVVDTGEAREVMHFALLIGYGAGAVCPRAAMATIHYLAESEMLEEDLTPEEAVDRYITAIKKGLLKTFSRMGISTIRSYRGAQIFEAVGLAKEFVDRYFTHTPTRIQGVGLPEIARETLQRHVLGFPSRGRPKPLLEAGGAYHVRKGGEAHMWSAEAIYKFQSAVRNNDYAAFKEFTALCDDRSRERATIRSLIGFKPGDAIPIEEVEPVEAITPRFTTAAMSFGSISAEAHEAVAIAMNRIGGRSNSGEGGEDPARFTPDAAGDLRRSAIKQIASGRFGVTAHYLVNADELQIKMAQGAKPGEGGQLPGHKVSEDIARVRHTTPGVTLISPPPHHDIYSIEDLAQLIYDLKMTNPRANVSVKLVSKVGVGTIASGVAKAKADLVLISGHDGGTGASPLTSIKHAGLPWELGLAETQQSLINNHLREVIRVQTDGQLKTGRDVAIAALLGAEEFGFGTSVLIALGCVMMRKCHLNTCPVGVATQDPRLRCRFTGKPEYVVNFMRFLAQELREWMAELGFRTVDEMVGRVERLRVEGAVEHWKSRGLDFSALFEAPEDPDLPRRRMRAQEHEVHEALDQKLIALATDALEKKTPVEAELPVRNVNRSIGATLSGEIARRYGGEGLPDDTIRMRFKGSAGQSFGAFLARGVTFRLEGDANDYVGKGLSGGRIIVEPPRDATFIPSENIIAGNVCLYGATSGELFLNGVAGERFAIRNSGARAVVEGVGDHGCEYMTGGVIVVLGATGYNFAAGMSGGVAYVYDPTELFETRCNLGMVDLETVWNEADEEDLRALLQRHVDYTNSSRAKMILEDWVMHFPRFVKVMPIEYRRVLERMREHEPSRADTVSASEEVYPGK